MENEKYTHIRICEPKGFTSVNLINGKLYPISSIKHGSVYFKDETGNERIRSAMSVDLFTIENLMYRWLYEQD